MHNVGIYVFDDVEVLDFAGPFEVFSTASRVFGRDHPGQSLPFTVFTIGLSRSPIRARGGLRVTPEYSIEQHPAIDLLLIPGGVVTAELEKPELIAWIEHEAIAAHTTASVCTGAFLLAKAGLLRGHRVTTHWEDIADLRELEPAAQVLENIRWVDEGRLLTSAGISAGLDMSLHLVAKLASQELAVKTARQMDYDWQQQA